MYREHQPPIAFYAGALCAGFVHVAEFVLVSIRLPLWRTPSELAAHRDGSPAHRWGAKRAGFARLDSDGAEIARTLWGIHRTTRGDADALLAYAASLPGFGLAKGGFLLQLCFGLSGCLDTHNLERFGLAEKAFQVAGSCGRSAYKRPETMLSHARRYNATVARCGGTARLWDSWCRHVARTQPNRYRDANEVSAYHTRALALEA